MNNEKVKSKFVNSKIILLRDFGIEITPEIKEHLASLYPSEIDAENYTRQIIFKKLGKIS